MLQLNYGPHEGEGIKANDDGSSSSSNSNNNKTKNESAVWRERGNLEETRQTRGKKRRLSTQKRIIPSKERPPECGRTRRHFIIMALLCITPSSLLRVLMAHGPPVAFIQQKVPLWLMRPTPQAFAGRAPAARAAAASSEWCGELTRATGGEKPVQRRPADQGAGSPLKQWRCTRKTPVGFGNDRQG